MTLEELLKIRATCLDSLDMVCKECKCYKKYYPLCTISLNEINLMISRLKREENK